MIGVVAAHLDARGVSYALIGGLAVNARGHARFTLDSDLLTTDRQVLQEAFWSSLRDSDVTIDVRRGDFDDPLAGVVHIGAHPESVDIVVGRWTWEQRVIDRAEPLPIDGFTIPVPLTSDLILLKVAAGGPIDRQDIIRLLEVGPREPLIAEVNEKIGELPADCLTLWESIVRETE
jgi:hypothetical protein